MVRMSDNTLVAESVMPGTWRRQVPCSPIQVRNNALNCCGQGRDLTSRACLGRR